MMKIYHSNELISLTIDEWFDYTYRHQKSVLGYEAKIYPIKAHKRIRIERFIIIVS